MSTPRALIAIVAPMLFSTGVVADPTKYVYVGDIPVTCPITINRSPAQLPPSFRVTPELAVRRASAETNVKCNSIFEQLVYADTENYYIIKSVLGPMGDKVEAVVVNGVTGKVSHRK